MLRKSLRSLAYRTPAYRWLGLGKLPDYDQAFWDRKLSTDWKPYLGGTISVETRNAVTLSLIRICAPGAKSLLDIGCASGSLFRMPGCDYTYTGVDISEVAIREAGMASPSATFHVSTCQNYRPTGTYDVIVFNEMLYFLTVDAATNEVGRYAGHLNENGILIVSMKNDPKAAAIFKLLARDFRWLNSILWQEKNVGPDYAVRDNRERPGYLVAALGV